MALRKIDDNYEQSLVKLLDDDSPVVRGALINEYKRLDIIGIQLLKNIILSKRGKLSDVANNILKEIQGPDPKDEFIQFIQSMNYELETGCLFLSRIATPNFETKEVCLKLDEISSRCMELINPPSSAWETCHIINRVLYHEYGFRGNVENYNDPLNSFLNYVLVRRTGIPISLSILYILIAQRCGLELEPIGMPGRFLVGCFLDKTPFYIDPFENGMFRTLEELEEILSSNNHFPQIGYLAPISVGDVLCQCCRVLVRQYTLKNNPARAKQFNEFSREFAATYRKHS